MGGVRSPSRAGLLPEVGVEHAFRRGVVTVTG